MKGSLSTLVFQFGGRGRSRAVLSACAFMLACASAVLGNEAGVSLACGDSSGAWFIHRSPLGPVLWRLPSDAPSGTAQRAANLGALPERISSAEGSVYMLFGPLRTGNGENSWPIRRVRWAGGRFSGVEAAPPLIVRGTPVDFVASGSATAHALVRSAETGLALWSLRGNVWERSEARIDRGATTTRLAPGVFGASLWHEHEAEGGIVASIVPIGAGGGVSTEGWPAPAGLERIFSTGGQVVGLAREDERVALYRLRPGAASRLASLEPSEGDRWVAPWNGAIVAIRSDDARGTRLSARVISLNGETFFDGPLGIAPFLTAKDVLLLSMALMSVLSAVGYFVIRGALPGDGALVLPEGWSLASSGRRAMAGAIDGGVAVLIAAVAVGWERGGVRAVLAPGSDLAPIVLALSTAIAVLMGSAGEALFSRSLGKALMRCRVVTVRGDRIGIGRAIGRNAVRFICPPLGMAWMLDTPERQLHLCGTVVVTEAGSDSSEPPLRE